MGVLLWPPSTTKKEVSLRTPPNKEIMIFDASLMPSIAWRRNFGCPPLDAPPLDEAVSSLSASNEFWDGPSEQLKNQAEISRFNPTFFIHSQTFTGLVTRALDRGRIGVFYAFKMPKTHWRWCRGLKIRFYKKKSIFVKMTSLIHFIQLIMQEYDSKCLKMYLITLKVF
jgi:hypothetical protein